MPFVLVSSRHGGFVGQRGAFFNGGKMSLKGLFTNRHVG
jgi:hypothetical protein